jgi:hypothetical protein
MLVNKITIHVTKAEWMELYWFLIDKHELVAHALWKRDANFSHLDFLIYDFAKIHLNPTKCTVWTNRPAGKPYSMKLGLGEGMTLIEAYREGKITQINDLGKLITKIYYALIHYVDPGVFNKKLNLLSK